MTTKMVKKQDPLCTVDELMDIITAETGGMVVLPSSSYDEVYEGIFIGDESIARNIPSLKRLGIKFVVNTAEGKTNYHVNTNHVMYQKIRLVYLGLQATDTMNFKMSQHFHKAADFIDEALASADGKVLVHCREGVSRSSTTVIAFLMIKRGMTAQDAVRLVRSGREVCPNQGFLQQLCDLNQELMSSHQSK